MKKTLSIIMALIMLIGIIPMSVSADDVPVAKNLTVTNQVNGECDSTVELAWEKSVSYIGTSYHIHISKSYDGEVFKKVTDIYNSVEQKTSYTYTCVDEDRGKTIYLGVSYEMGETPRNERKTVSVKIKEASGDSTGLTEAEKERYKELFIQGLADPTFTKKTENYSNNKFVVGTKAVWECKLYTLTATVTKVNGSKATFDVTFDSKIPYECMDSSTWSNYEIKLYGNGEWETYRPGDKMQYTVDTSKSDGLSCTSTTGMQFFRITVEKNERNTVVLNSSSPYFADIVKNRRVSPGDTYFNEFWIEDTYTLGYMLQPGNLINQNSFNVTKNSISLGTYAFDSVVKYRVKGASSWQQKSFAKNKAMTISGLKAGTVYEIQPQFRIPYTDPENNKSTNVLANIGSKLTLTTTINKKPAVTSVKVSKIKYGKQTINGYWQSNGIWHPTEKFNTASYTVTVKLKSVPKNVKGLRLKAGNAIYYAKGSKKTYTFKLTYRDTKKIKGKKMSFNLAFASNTINNEAVGVGPAKTVKYKLKNGTYKVK